jgi:hypothetical protein
MLPLQYGAIVVAGLANFVIGFLFHGPLFGKLWMKLANIHPTGKEKLSDMVPQMVQNLIVNIIFAFGLAIMYSFASASAFVSVGVAGGMVCAFVIWFTFVVTSTSIDVIWMGKSYKLWLFEAVSSLVCILAMGAVIGGW